MRKAAEAKALLDTLGKSARDTNAQQIADEQKLIQLHKDEITSLKDEAHQVGMTADAYKVYNVQALYGGRSDMQSHLSDMERELQYETLLNRQRWLLFTSPQQAYAWRQNEYNQRLLMNRAEWAGYQTADQYLAYLQREIVAQRGLSQELLTRAEDYKKVADAAAQYYNALASGEAHKTTTILAPRADLAGVQQTEAALAAVPQEITTTINVDDAKAMQDLATWRSMLQQMPERVDVAVDLDDAAAVAKAEAFFAWMRAHRAFGATETLTVLGGAAGGGGGGPPPVAPAPMPEEPNPNDINAIAAAEKNAAAAAQELSQKYEQLGQDWAQDVKWENAYTAGLESAAAASTAAAAGSDSLAAAQARAAALTQAAIIQNQADAAALKAQTLAAAASAAANAASGKSAAEQAKAAAAQALANQAAASAQVKAAAAAAAYQAAQGGATVAATKAAAASAANAMATTQQAQAAAAAVAPTVALSTAQQANAILTAKASAANQYAGYILASATVPVIGAARGWAGLSTQVYLFGGVMPGILGHITAWHLGLDYIIEALAVLIPALIALGVAIAGQVQVWTDLFSRMQATYQVADAFGVKIYPLTGQLQSLAQAVQPQTYVLFGEALNLVNAKSGLFTQLAQQASAVLDKLGARMVLAVTSSATFGTVMQHAAADLMGLGTVIGNIFGIFGNLLKVMPGYAEIILSAWETVTHVLEMVTASPIVQWLLNLGLAAHGAIVYIGLLGTAFAYLVTTALSGLATGLLRGAVLLDGLGAAGSAAATGMLSLGAAAEGAAALPWGWIGLVAAGIGVLVYQLVHATGAANQFASAVESKILQNTTIANLASGLSNALASANMLLNQQSGEWDILVGKYQIFNDQVNKSRDQWSQFHTLTQNIANTRAEIALLTQDQQTYNSNLQTAIGTFGSAKAALAAFGAAGVTSSEFLTKSKSDFAQYTAEAQGADAALRAVTQTTGRYGAAQNALNFSLFDTANALGFSQDTLQKVTQAEDSLINVLIGGEQSVVAFQQAIQQMGTDAHVAGAHLGDLHNQSLALTSDYYSSVIPALQKTIDSLQMMEATTPQLTTVIATQAKEALQWAGSNTEARVTMVDLINNALGPGTVSLQSLDKWIKNNSTSLNGMSNIIAQVTVNASQLAGVLQNNLNAMLAQAAADAYGGQKALDAFARGVLNGQQNTSTFVNGVGQQVLKMFEQMYQGDVPRAKNAFIDWAKNGLGLGQQAADDLWNEMSTKLTPAMQQAQQQAATTANTMDTTFIASLKSIGFTLGPVAQQAVMNFTNALLQSGDTSNRTTSARAQLIHDLEAVGVNSQTATRLVQGLQTQIDGLKGKNVPVSVTGSGSGTITFAEQNIKNAQTGYLEFHAAGGAVGGAGGPTQDNQIIAASTGEWVIKADSVNHLERDYGPGIMKAINSYANGGSVGWGWGMGHYANGGPIGGSDLFGIANAPNWMGDQMSYAATQAEGSAAQAMYNDAKTKFQAEIAALQALGVGGQASTGNLSASSGYQAFVQVAAQLGWGPALLQDWVNVEMREAGFSLTATNPSSGAYGMAQFILGPTEYYTYGGDPNTYIGQAVAMANYIAQRYGTPAGAWAHEQAFNWYAAGGPVIDAIKKYTANTGIREAMALGSYLETDFNPALHKGEHYGPFLMNLGKNPTKGRIKAAENPNYAASYALKYYEQAFSKAGGSAAARKNALGTALKTANIAEHVSQLDAGSPSLDASKAAAGWDLILTDLGVPTPFNPVGGTGGTSGDYATRLANMKADWKKVQSTFTTLAKEPKPKSGKGASLWQGWLYDLDVARTAMGNMTKGMDEVSTQHISDVTWGLLTGAGGGGLANVFAEGHIADSRFWPVTVSTPPKPPHGGKTPPPKATAHKPDPWVGSNVYNKELTAYRNQLDAFLVQARDAAKDWGILNPAPGATPVTPAPVAVPPPTTYTPVNLSGYATMGGPATPVYGSNPTMGFASGGQVGMADMVNMLSGFSGGGAIPLAVSSRSGTPMSLDQVVGALAKSNQGAPSRTLSEGASATRVGLNVENLTVNNPVPEPPSQSITRSANRLAFLAARGP